MPYDGFTALEIVTLSKLVTDDLYRLNRDDVTVGLYEPNLSVRIYGTLKVGNDYQQHARPDLWACLALLIATSRSPRRDNLVEQIVDMTKEDAVALKDTNADLIESMKERMPMLPCRGKVSAHLSLTRLKEDTPHGQAKERKPHKG